jgi:hypothetical protein
LFCRDAAETNALVSEEDRRSGQKKLTKLENRIQAPALKEQNPAAEQSDRGEEDVIIARQGRFEAPHEVEARSSHGQHDADDAGPIQAGVDQGGTGQTSACTLGNLTPRPAQPGKKPLAQSLKGVGQPDRSD